MSTTIVIVGTLAWRLNAAPLGRPNRLRYISRAAAAAFCHHISPLYPLRVVLTSLFVLTWTSCTASIFKTRHWMAIHDPDHLARRGERLRDVTIAHLILSWFFIALRTWTRCYIRPSFGWDDGTMILAGVRPTSAIEFTVSNTSDGR